MLAGFRRKSIIATVVSIAVLSLAAACVIYDLTVMRTNRLVDTLTYCVYLNGGEIPTDQEALDELERVQVSEGLNPAVTEETPYATRYFVVYLDKDGSMRADLRHIVSIDEQRAFDLALEAKGAGKKSGWYDNLRYGLFDNSSEAVAVFVDANTYRIKDRVVFYGSIAMLALYAFTVILLNLFYNAHATKPVQESFERQKRFISNASHELKTPLTLIMTDADLAALEHGPNEYLDEIKAECRDMSDLITQMVTLSRMDEDAHPLEFRQVDVGACVEKVVHSWRGTAESTGLSVGGTIDSGITAKTDEAALKQILVILMDNATKYCDAGGTITVDAHSRDRKHVCIYVENSYANAPNVEPQRLFERFYRADAERADKIGHGIGLSLAKETAASLGGVLDVYTKENPATIGFKLVLKASPKTAG